jgi:ketosteroid isomerase-like protein
MTAAHSVLAPAPARVIAAFMELNPDPAIFADDAVSWHNYDELEIPTIPDSFDAIRAIRTVVPDFRIDTDLRTSEVGEMSIAQYTVSGTLPDGSALRAPAVMVIHHRDGKVVRVEEYVDTAQLAGLFAAWTSVSP